jgi:hypothetical protein
MSYEWRTLGPLEYWTDTPGDMRIVVCFCRKGPPVATLDYNEITGGKDRAERAAKALCGYLNKDRHG